MDDINRQKNGRFTKGQTGNPNGRPRKRYRDPRLPATRRDAIFRVADRMITTSIDGKTEKISLFEACLLQIAKAGATGNRIAAKNFIELAMATSETDLGRRIATRRMMEHMNALEEANERNLQKGRTGVVTMPVEHFGFGRRLDDGFHEGKDSGDQDGAV